MNWYRNMIITANYELGISLGKWLLMSTRGDVDENTVQEEIRNYVSSNPTTVDPILARSSAIQYVEKLLGEVREDQIQRLDSWLSLITNPIEMPKQNVDQIEESI